MEYHKCKWMFVEKKMSRTTFVLYGAQTGTGLYFLQLAFGTFRFHV